MLPILHCDVSTSMFYADHAQDHTLRYTVQVAVIVTTSFNIIEVLCSTKHEKLN